MTIACPSCDGSGLVPHPDRRWYQVWRVAECPDCRGTGQTAVKSIVVGMPAGTPDVVIEDCEATSDPEHATPAPEPRQGPGLPKSHPNRVKPSPPEPEPERRRCPNCQYPLD